LHRIFGRLFPVFIGRLQVVFASDSRRFTQPATDDARWESLPLEFSVAVYKFAEKPVRSAMVAIATVAGKMALLATRR
jgi:hypothetical protein